MNRKRKRKLKKLPIIFTVLIVIIILCVIIQTFFMPKWVNGNTNSTSTSKDGVHTQKDTDINDNEVTKNITVA